jgi:HD-like signal output (HDOD) protein
MKQGMATLLGSPLFTREKLLRIARSLPADLEVFAQLGQMLQDINSDLDEVARLLRRDVALASRIVRISNSAMFGGGGSGQVASVEEAVNRVGFSEILKLVGTASAARISERPLEFYDINPLTLRNNMLYGALAAEALARSAGADSRVAYTAGLLRPLGILVLDGSCRGQLPPPPRYTPDFSPTYEGWESATFGLVNTDVAATVLTEWRFPTELVQAVRRHHLLRREDEEQPLAALLNLANGLALRVTRALPGEAALWETTEEKLRAAGVQADELEPVIEWTNKAFDACIAALGI